MRQFLTFLVLLLITTTISQGSVVVIFVDDNSQAFEPQGTSWADAYVSLEEAILSVPQQPNNEFQFWVAEGLYKPETVAGWEISPNMTFYGGFIGHEFGPQSRLGATSRTILSGDLDNNGKLSSGDATHLFVQRFAFITSMNHTPMVFDGFTFEHARAAAQGTTSSENSGGCIYISGEVNPSCSLELNNCIFRDNYARYYGAAIYSSYAIKLQIKNTQFLRNTSDTAGGAIYIEMSGATFPLLEYGFLTGIYETVISHCLFAENMSGQGAAIYSNSISADSTFLISNSLFRENIVTTNSGTIYLGSDYPTNFSPGTYQIYHSTIADNIGSGVHVAGDGMNDPIFGIGLKDVEIRSSIIRFNGNAAGPANIRVDAGQSTSMWVQYNNIVDNLGQPWPGVGNIAGNPSFLDPTRDLYVLRGDSACINAADDKTVLIDAADLDEDLIYYETIEYDLRHDRREEYYPRGWAGLNALGSNPQTLSDMGCYEAHISQLFLH